MPILVRKGVDVNKHKSLYPTLHLEGTIHVQFNHALVSTKSFY